MTPRTCRRLQINAICQILESPVSESSDTSSASNHLSGTDLWEFPKREKLCRHICQGRLTNNESLVEVKVCTCIVCQTTSHYVHDLCECVARTRTHTHKYTHTYIHTFSINPQSLLTNCITTKNNLFTYLLAYSMQQSPSWEDSWFSASQRNCSHFTEFESSVPHSQMPAIYTYPEPA